MRKGNGKMNRCEFDADGICINGNCPMCCENCPVENVPEVCKFDSRNEPEEEACWIEDTVYSAKGKKIFYCSNCNHWQKADARRPSEDPTGFNFCPQCGRRMKRKPK